MVLTLHEEGIWITIDAEEDSAILDQIDAWRWDPGPWSRYTRVPSRNGYYVPDRSHNEVWPIIRRLHFAFVGRVARKFSKLDAKSQHTHMPAVLAYLRQALNQYVPEPEHTRRPETDNPLQEIAQQEPTYRDLPETERKAVVQSRIGQGRFREELIAFWGRCAVTGCRHHALLRASHIKPWRVANNVERLDRFNGLLLIPNLDTAFDAGLISFTTSGRVLISSILSEEDRRTLGIHPDINIAGLVEQHYPYLAYHQRHIFRAGNR